MKRHRLALVVIAIASSAIALAGASGTSGSAAAATKTGWVGPAGTTGYLHTSTIINAPKLTAESKIYHSFGATAPNDTIGVRARLFKSGALCEAVDYQYNYYAAPEWKARTTATCGSGWYNSHGFVAVWNTGTASFDEYVTFPSDPLQWTAPTVSARDAVITESSRSTGSNSRGQRYGSAASSKDGGASLDLILAIGSEGKVGYVKASDINQPATRTRQVKSSAATRTIPVWDRNGTTKLDTFEVR